MEDLTPHQHLSDDISASNVLFIAKSLALALQQVGYLKPTPDETTAITIKNWLEMFRPQDLDECVKNFQRDKENLLHEIRNLKSQISVKNEIIEELQRKISQKTEQLSHIEALLQREIVLRSSLETQKMGLMSAVSELKLQKAALERSIVEMGNRQIEINNHTSIQQKLTEKNRFSHIGMSTSFHGSTSNVEKVKSSRTPPSSFKYHTTLNFNSLPRPDLGSFNSTNQNDEIFKNFCIDNNANLKEPRCFGFTEDEKVIRDLSNSFLSQNINTESINRKPKRLKNLFGKLRRSRSGDFEDVSTVDFQRGGFRATASPRLCWSGKVKYELKDFKIWNIEDICSWLCDIGLGYTEENAKKWLANGTKNLLASTPYDIEKELNLKSQLHKKKIVLAISELSGKETDKITINAGKLNTAWVVKWLDDIGLPQLKTSFLFERVDGRMLHKLTMDDLAHLNIQTLLFVSSIRRGIQLMREINWHEDFLINRIDHNNKEQQPIHLWTANRVMEWLSSVDLGEYATNLRGAGVHGALMKYEPKFNAELLAQLLCIPQSKTLLRRHLSTRFKELLGKDLIQQKREAENTLGYQPLTISGKIKYPKRGQFSLKRRRSNKASEEWSDFVCPFGSSDNEETISKPISISKNCLSSNY